MGMSTIYPKYSWRREGDTVIMEQRLLKTVTHLHLFTTRCAGCGVCVDACPKEAIHLGMVGASIRGLTEDPPIYIDQAKCSYCGVFVILCPYYALRLEIDDKPQLPILEHGGFPIYDTIAEIDLEKCVRCTICYEVCPNDAIINEIPVFEGKGRRRAAQECTQRKDDVCLGERVKCSMYAQLVRTIFILIWPL